MTLHFLYRQNCHQNLLVVVWQEILSIIRLTRALVKQQNLLRAQVMGGGDLHPNSVKRLKV